MTNTLEGEDRMDKQTVVEILGYKDLPLCEVCAEQEATKAILGKGSTIHRHIGQAIAICDDCLKGA